MGYRFGFNGKENDNEVKGVGNSLDFGARIYDSRLGRWLIVDPLTKKYPDISPYAYAANNPIFFIDPDGEKVKAFSVASQTLVLKTLNYAFGKDHGFNFENNTLIHNGETPKNMTPQQTLMFNYLQETLVKSQTITTVIANQNISVSQNSDGEIVSGGAVQDGNATTFFYGATRTYKDNGTFMAPTITSSTQDNNEILVTSGLIQNGINLTIEGGDKVFGVEHATLHELAHGMMNVIMNEMKGEYNGVNFNDMTETQRSDWAIRFTNTLLQSQNQSLETGQGQHGRESGTAPNKNDVAPLSE
ncbi:MAG: RHS repeat-associated core domain-containing protein [Bacteroidetes bacterium]|nr:RHS repeat-associated core domain-containing protein [Bacteroidota bacterium]